MYENTAVLKLQENREQGERIQEADQARIEELKEELDACEGVTNAGRKQVFNFMLREGIWHVSDLGYKERVKFIAYLSGRYGKSGRQIYRDEFDRIKRKWLSCPAVLPVGARLWIPPYQPVVFYLPYHPDNRVAELVKGFDIEEALVWDFTIKAPEKMKYQVYRIIHYVLELELSLTMKRRYLTGLNRYFHFCREHGIEDIELVEQHQVRLFSSTLTTHYEQCNYLPIVRICRRELFLHAKEINWRAHIWYLDRFHIQPERFNPSKPVGTLSFVEVEHAGNRKLLKDYMRYSLGTTYLAISHLQVDNERIKRFMIELEQEKEKDVRAVNQEQIEAYFERLGSRNLSAKTFNDYVMCIHHFFRFLQARGHIENLPFRPEYYQQKCIPRHHDRSVVPETATEIIQTLHKLPENRRMIFLHLWCLGLRISEICTLKGNAYSRQNGDTWIKVYQIKMRDYKRIPMPKALYELMQIYLKKHQIGPEDYVFQSRSGGPYRSHVFYLQMRRFCEENHFQAGEYMFKNHDYRHSVATWFYDSGVSLQGVRDYLGHDKEEMTKQYIDFMPKRIEKANESFFEQHSLAYCLRNGGGET